MAAVLGITWLGSLVGLGALGLIWPDPDRALAPTPELSAATLAAKPSKAVTLLMIGSDANRIGAPLNGAAPSGPANADAVMLIRLDPAGPLQVLNLPTELAVTLPGEKLPKRLGDLYRIGGVALTADAVRELVGLERPQPDRYVVLPRGGLRDLVNGLGGLEMSPPRKMKYTDKTQKFSIDLEAGLQRLMGSKVEQMVRFRDKDLGEAGRRSNQQLVQTALRQRMLEPARLERLPSLIATMQEKVETNLSVDEALSLLAAGLDQRHPIAFSSLPLAPAKEEHEGLRELAPSALTPLWKPLVP